MLSRLDGRPGALEPPKDVEMPYVVLIIVHGIRWAMCRLLEIQYQTIQNATADLF